MGRVRLSAAAFGAAALLGACRAEAAPAAELAVPAGWRALPEIASAIAEAAKPDRAEAWGEPARGCYAAAIALQGEAAKPDALAAGLLDDLKRDVPGIAMTDVVVPAAGADRGILSLRFDRAAYRGRLRAELAGDGKIRAVACFWNAREPIACESACVGVIGGAK